MTQALKMFNQGLSEAKELADCFDKLNGHPDIIPPDALKKASLVMALTAWETYVEDVATELFHQKFSVIKGSMIGNFAEKQFEERLKFFHNPNSKKTKHLFEEFFNIDVTEYWEWNNVYPKDAREQLNLWISKRGEAVHRVNVDFNQPQIIRKDELAKCIRFIDELAKATDKVLETL
jgi:hypothetical protein